MRYIKHKSGGEASTMGIFLTDVPQVRAGQVLIKVVCFGVNRADTLQRQGKYPPPPGESHILGLEVAGMVIEKADDVLNVEINQMVFGLVAGGAYAEYVVVDVRHIMPIPANCSVEQAAGIAEVFLTAFQSLCWLGQLKSKQNVLVHAGASGVGLAAIQLARLHDCNVYVTTSNQHKADVCEKMGATKAIIYPMNDFVEVLKSDNYSADVIIDVVGGDYLNRNLKVINQDGYIVQLAMLNGRICEKLDIALLLGKRATIRGSTLRNRSDEYKAKLVAEFQQKYLPAFESGTLVSNIFNSYPASSIDEVHRRLENNDSIGKFICYW